MKKGKRKDKIDATEVNYFPLYRLDRFIHKEFIEEIVLGTIERNEVVSAKLSDVTAELSEAFNKEFAISQFPAQGKSYLADINALDNEQTESYMALKFVVKGYKKVRNSALKAAAKNLLKTIDSANINCRGKRWQRACNISSVIELIENKFTKEISLLHLDVIMSELKDINNRLIDAINDLEQKYRDMGGDKRLLKAREKTDEAYVCLVRRLSSYADIAEDKEPFISVISTINCYLKDVRTTHNRHLGQLNYQKRKKKEKEVLTEA